MNRILLVLAAAGLFTATSCSRNEAPGSPDGNAQVRLILTDAPAAYDKVLVNIKEVRINLGEPEAEGVPEGSTKGKWVNYPLSPNFAQSIDLLTLRNGGTMYMGEPLALPAGKISQIRLILNETGNAVVVDGVEQPLTTPSGQTSGLKIKFNETLQPNGVYDIMLDFDAGRSVVKAGNSGKYILKPVINAKTVSAEFGVIKGFVLPSEAKTTVYLLKGADTIASTLPELPGSALGEGYFKFINLTSYDTPYTLSFNADDNTGYKDGTVTNVLVQKGLSTTVPTVNLSK